MFHKEGALLRVQFLFFFDIDYPSLSKLNNVSLSYCKKKNVPKNVYEVDQEFRGGELSLSVCPGERKNCKFPGVCPGGGACLQVKLNRA